MYVCSSFDKCLIQIQLSDLAPEDVLAHLLALLPGHRVALSLRHGSALLGWHRHALLSGQSDCKIMIKYIK